LATEHTARNKVAELIFTRTGAMVVPQLLDEAISTGKRPSHRIRLLNIVLKIGATLTADQWFMLHTASHKYTGAVQDKIVELLVRTGTLGLEWASVWRCRKWGQTCSANRKRIAVLRSGSGVQLALWSSDGSIVKETPNG
jgi:hypothetical protein